MVQAPNKTVFNLKGKEDSDFNNAIVLVASNLPFYIELRTGALISFLINFYNFTDRTAVNNWLNTKQKTGFKFEISEHLHLAFSDQRDGKGTAYWWTLYYDNSEKKRILETIKIQEHLASTKLINNQKKQEFLWNGLTFCSQTEIRIAKVLCSKNIMFFANANGFMALNGMPIANFDNKDIEKAEVDFLVFHNKKIMILEVDGEHHNEAFMKGWDCKRDRIFLRHGISTVRFPANQCWENSSAVVEEFLGLFN